VKYRAKRIRVVFERLGFKASEPDSGLFLYLEHPDTKDVLIFDKDNPLPEDYVRRKLAEINFRFDFFHRLYIMKK
jgi:hypothetical protein